MLQLQELHGPFAVRQAALAEFEMPVAPHAARQAFGFHARLELADLAELCIGERAYRVSQRVRDVVEEILAERPVPGDEPGAQQRLMFPRVRP